MKASSHLTKSKLNLVILILDKYVIIFFLRQMKLYLNFTSVFEILYYSGTQLHKNLKFYKINQ